MNQQCTFTSEQIASICDHTFLNSVEVYKMTAKPGESPIRLRQEAFFRFLQKVCESPYLPFGVCVRAEDVPHAKDFLTKYAPQKIALVAVIGFPDGSWHKSHYKFIEAQYALSEGADEIDMPLNWQALKQGNHASVLEEIRLVCRLVHQKKGLFKLILETSLLNAYQVEDACNLARHAEVDFIKTSTGYGAYGAQVHSLKQILSCFPGGIKISGGVNRENVIPFLEAVQVARRNVQGKEEDTILDPRCLRIGESALFPL